MHVTILGKRWRLRFVPNMGGDDKTLTLGDCSDPRDKGKEIRIRQGLAEEQELEVCIHEAMHAAAWSQSEEFVEEASYDIARMLWRLGWRKTS